MTKSDLKSKLIPIDFDVSDFDTAVFVNLKKVIKDFHFDKIKPITKLYYVRELLRINASNKYHLKLEQLKYLLLKNYYKVINKNSDNIDLLILYIQDLIMIQEREEKLIRFIANTPQKEDRTKLLEEIAYLYTILELNTNRSNQLSVTKKAQKKEKLSYDNLKNQSRVFSDEISYIVQKVKVMEKEK